MNANAILEDLKHFVQTSLRSKTFWLGVAWICGVIQHATENGWGLKQTVAWCFPAAVSWTLHHAIEQAGSSSSSAASDAPPPPPPRGASDGIKLGSLLLCLALLPACITRAEYAQDVRAWRAYHEATKPDLVALYGSLPEPSRSTRLGLVDQDDSTLRAAEARAGIASVAS